MAIKTIPRSAPAAAPAPPAQAKPEFSPSEQLAEQVEGFQQAQAEIDRGEAERQARLREIQSRD